MNDKNFKRHMAYDALVILGLLALLTYITRLWPILLLIILGIFIAALRLLTLSSQKVEPAKPVVTPPPPSRPPTEADMQTMAYEIIQRRITQILQGKFPEARWTWENPCAKEDIMAGTPVYILLSRAGGYRRGRVVIFSLQVSDVVFESEPPKGNPPGKDPQADPNPKPIPTPGTPPAPPAPPSADDGDDEMEENFGLIAFQWVEAHIMELNDRCNEAIAQGKDHYLIPADELPVSESWEEICKELIRNGLHDALCCDEGILIEFEQ